jgi:hypothetical protein
VPGINLAHLIGTRRLIRAQRGADVAHEGDGRAGRGPDSEHPGTSAVRVTEGVPLPAGATNIDPAAASCGSSNASCACGIGPAK